MKCAGASPKARAIQQDARIQQLEYPRARAAQIVRAGRCRREDAGNGGSQNGSIGTRARPDPESRADDRGFGPLRAREREASGGGGAVPQPGSELLAIGSRQFRAHGDKVAILAERFSPIMVGLRDG